MFFRRPNDWSMLDRIAAATLLVAAVLELVAILALPVEGYDAQYHLSWISSWHTLWQTGIYYPHWLLAPYHFFGAPTFYFYPPFSYVVSSIIYLLFPSSDPSFIAKIFLVVTLAASGVTMWLYLRSRGSGIASRCMGTALYLFAPYRFLDLNTRASLSEHFAFVFLPLIFWSADRLLDRRKGFGSVVAMILLLSLLAVTSLPSFAAIMLALTVYAVCAPKPLIFQNVRWFGFIGISAILLSLFYLIMPVLYVQDLQLARLWDPAYIGPGSPIATLLSGENLRIGIYTTVTFLGGCVLLYYWWKIRGNSAAVASRDFWLLLAIIVLQLPYLPAPLFHYIPPFSTVQLPYRLSMVLMIMMARAWTERLDGRGNGWNTSGVVAGYSIVTIILVGGQLGGVQVHKHTPQQSGIAHEFFATRWMPHSENIDSPMRIGFSSDTQMILLPNNPEVALISTNHCAYSDTVVYESQKPAILTFHRAYWPQRHVRIDGHEWDVTPDSVGRVNVQVPAGRHTLTIQLDQSWGEKVGIWISLGTLTILLILGFIRLRSSQ